MQQINLLLLVIWFLGRRRQLLFVSLCNNFGEISSLIKNIYPRLEFWSDLYDSFTLLVQNLHSNFATYIMITVIFPTLIFMESLIFFVIFERPITILPTFNLWVSQLIVYNHKKISKSRFLLIIVIVIIIIVLFLRLHNKNVPYKIFAIRKLY